VQDKYGLSKANRLATPQLAYLKLQEKKYDEAISLYQKFSEQVSDNPTYQSMTRMALATCYEAKGEFEKAIEALSRVMAGPNDFFKEQAMFSLARVYRLNQQEEKSKEVFKEFVEKFESSPLLPLAKAHLN
jgi:tetratricopeptide (TPR) repeat protein